MGLETRNLKQHTIGLPAISVIVPVYNAEKTLRQCVDSILSQEYKDFELLLINDGSKDASPAICDEYARHDNRVRVFYKENGGVSSARNLGLDHAQGEWITFVDADDYITSNYLVNVDSYSDSDLILREYIWQRGEKQRVDHRVDSYNTLNKDSQIRNFLNTFLTTMYFRGNVAKFYKHSYIANLRFNQKMKVGEDACFVHHYLLQCSTMRVLHNAYYCVRLSDDNSVDKYGASTEYAIQSLQFLFQSFEQVKEKWDLSEHLFISYLVYFKNISRSDWIRKPSKWYRNQDVKKMYEYTWNYLSLMDKVKYKVVQLLSVIYR